MRRTTLDDMIKGWFVGPFSPTAHDTPDVEVALKRYAVGDREASHHHRIATEITLIVDGEVRMGSEKLAAGDIIVLNPGEGSDFEALTAVTLVAVKHPGARDDKYPDQ